MDQQAGDGGADNRVDLRLGGGVVGGERAGDEVVSVSHAGISEVVSVSDTYNLGTIWRKSRVFLRFLSLSEREEFRGGEVCG